MVKKPLICAFTVLFVLSHAPFSSAAEKKSGSFFSGFKKAKPDKEKAKAEERSKKKPGMLQALLGKKETDSELTEEEKKLVEEASKAAEVPVTSGPRQPVKLPPSAPVVSPKTQPWSPPKVPTAAVTAAPRNPNDTLALRAPQPFNKLVTSGPKPPKVSGDLSAADKTQR